MGKGYENYMSKKWFHPSNLGNMKRLWMAEQKSEADRKQQQLLKEQHDKEQEMFSNRQLLGDEKARLGLSFMYNPPIGLTNGPSSDGKSTAETKLEWRGAPREQWAKSNDNVTDQPFGIQVRDVRCIKCKRRGHINTDKVCPFYGVSKADDEDDPAADGTSSRRSEDMKTQFPKMSNRMLMENMKQDGYSIRECAITRDMAAFNEKRTDNWESKLYKKLVEISEMKSADEAVEALKSMKKKEKKFLRKKMKEIKRTKKRRAHKRNAR